MLFHLKIWYNGEYITVPNLDSNGYGYTDLTTDIYTSTDGEWLDRLLYFEGVHPTTRTIINLKNDDDVQALIKLYLGEGQTDIYLNLQLQSCIPEMSLQTIVYENQQSQFQNIETVTREIPLDVRSVSSEDCGWSDNTDDCVDNTISYKQVNLSDESEDNMSDLNSEDEECHNIIEEEKDDTSCARIGRLSDKMHGDYFKKTLDSKGKEIIELRQGQIFDDVKHFRRIVEEYAIQVGFTLDRKKKDKKRFRASCKNKECSWSIYASPFFDGITFKIKSVGPDHTCIGNLKGIGTTSTWIANQLLSEFKTNVDRSITEIDLIMQERFGVHFHKKKLYRAKRKAIELVSGNWAKSYALVPRYAKCLLESNPGAQVKMKCDGLHLRNPVFDRLFVSFVAQRDGFRNGLRPFIGLDGCFLKGPYGGQLLLAVALDSNSGIFPLAMMVCRQECEDTWGYFLECLMDHLGYTGSITFMSDRQKGLKNAVRKVCGNDRQRFCSRHLYANFRTKFPGVRLRTLFWAASKAFNEHDSNKVMEEIYSLDSKAHNWLMVDCKESLDKWARHAFDEISKNDHVTNNLAESFNSILGTNRGKPILTLLEWIRTKIMKRFFRRYQKFLEWTTPLPPNVMDKVKKNFQRGRHLHPSPASEWIFQVPDEEKIYKVNLQENTCQCREWQVSGIPCRHAMVCISKMRYDPSSYVHSSLSVEAYKNTYKGMIFPVPDKSMWPEDDSPIWAPPELVRKRGRPKVNRIKEVGEIAPSRDQRSVHHRCSLCKELGHNKSTCHLKERRANTSFDNNIVQQVENRNMDINQNSGHCGSSTCTRPSNTSDEVASSRHGG